jgi:hypothetical protein
LEGLRAKVAPCIQAEVSGQLGSGTDEVQLATP